MLTLGEWGFGWQCCRTLCQKTQFRLWWLQFTNKGISVTYYTLIYTQVCGLLHPHQ